MISEDITLDDIATEDYDYLHAPKNLSTGEPLPVNVSINKISLRSIDESEMTFSVTLEMWQSWVDYRLSYPSWASELYQVLDSSWIHKLWNPKLYFTNAVDGKLDNIITPSSFFWLTKGQRIYYCCRVILKLTCEMDLKYFPHDQQQCSVKMASSIFNTKDIVLVWSPRAEEPQLFSLQQFDVNRLRWESFKIPRGHGSEISSLELVIVLDRRTGYYLINVYIPTVLIVIMSMLTFWIPPDAVPARVTLGVTSLLTIITKQYQASMPSVSYIVALNVWLSCCIGFVFFSLLEFAAVIALSSGSKKQEKEHHHHQDLILSMVTLRPNGTWSTKNSWGPKHHHHGHHGHYGRHEAPKKENLAPKRLDYFSRFFFPLSFITFAVIYWNIY